ncbi:hypothetical protein [Aliivibrio kagoshimensis]|uniref:hypothetical protein n=1 Tax=Aliivibrio kagoshimensis TaxID=2910230 RepID=UPI003D1011F8
MLRIGAIFGLLLVSFLLIRYRTNEKLQKFVIISVLGSLVAYILVVMTMELFR